MKVQKFFYIAFVVICLALFISIFCFLPGSGCNLIQNPLYGEKNNPDNYKGWVIRRVLLEHVGYDGYNTYGFNLQIGLTKGTIKGVSETRLGYPNAMFQWDCFYKADTTAFMIRPVEKTKRWHEGDTIK